LFLFALFFLNHLGQVTLPITIEHGFILVDTQVFSDIILIYKVVENGKYRAHHGHDIQKSKKYGKPVFPQEKNICNTKIRRI
jgi:hypothetical protein